MIINNINKTTNRANPPPKPTAAPDMFITSFIGSIYPIQIGPNVQSLFLILPLKKMDSHYQKKKGSAPF